MSKGAVCHGLFNADVPLSLDQAIVPTPTWGTSRLPNVARSWLEADVSWCLLVSCCPPSKTRGDVEGTAAIDENDLTETCSNSKQTPHSSFVGTIVLKIGRTVCEIEDDVVAKSAHILGQRIRITKRIRMRTAHSLRQTSSTDVTKSHREFTHQIRSISSQQTQTHVSDAHIPNSVVYANIRCESYFNTIRQAVDRAPVFEGWIPNRGAIMVQGFHSRGGRPTQPMEPRS